MSSEEIWVKKQRPHKANPPIPVKVKKVVKNRAKKTPLKTKPGVARETTPSKKTGTGFRFKSMSVFLTFPQYEGDLTKEEVLQIVEDFCEAKGRVLEECIVALENHGQKKDGRGIETKTDPGVHWHIAMKVNKAFDTILPNFFDEIVNDKHGHVESAKDWRALCVYCAKDGNYVTKGVDVEAFKEAIKNKKGVKHEVVAKEIINKPEIELKELCEKWPGYVLQHSNKVQDFIGIVRNFEDEVKLPYYGIQPFIPNDDQKQTYEICCWLKDNLHPAKREHKKPQLYIYGPTGKGKSTLSMYLQQRFKTYLISTENFWGAFDNTFQLAIMDEFAGQKTIHELNQFVEGTPMSLPQKGQKVPFKKTKNIPVIIFSNSHPETIYKKTKEEHPERFEAFMARFKVVHLTEDLRIPFLSQSLSEPQVVQEKPLVIEELESSEDEIVPPTQPLPRPLRRDTAQIPLYQLAVTQEEIDNLKCDDEILQGNLEGMLEDNAHPEMEDEYSHEEILVYGSDEKEELSEHSIERRENKRLREKAKGKGKKKRSKFIPDNEGF